MLVFIYHSLKSSSINSIFHPIYIFYWSIEFMVFKITSHTNYNKTHWLMDGVVVICIVDIYYGVG